MARVCDLQALQEAPLHMPSSPQTLQSWGRLAISAFQRVAGDVVADSYDHVATLLREESGPLVEGLLETHQSLTLGWWWEEGELRTHDTLPRWVVGLLGGGVLGLVASTRQPPTAVSHVDVA